MIATHRGRSVLKHADTAYDYSILLNLITMLFGVPFLFLFFLFGAILMKSLMKSAQSLASLGLSFLQFQFNA